MLCLPDCGCHKSIDERTVEEDIIIHDDSSYRPLSESIPLLPKDTTMITFDSDASQYTFLAIIGKGFNDAATVSAAKHIPTGQQVAIKKTDLESCSDVSYIQQEILVTRQLRHENLLPFYCAFVYRNEVWAVMPLMTLGSARDILYSSFTEGLPEIAIGLVLKDILAALDYVHKRGFIHRSIKASHILLSSSGKALLSGLRYSCNVIYNGKWQNVIHSFPSDSVSNLNWLSPELLEQNLMGYNAKSDIYSLGVTACELANGIVPFAEMPPTQMLLEKLQGYHPRPLDSNTCFDIEDMSPSQSNLLDIYRMRRFSDSFHVFTELCLQRDPVGRPSAAQLARHVFIKQCKKANISLLDIFATVTPITDQYPMLKEEDELDDKFQELTLSEPWNF